jgi:cell fate regulator YaaT (PSP1 superfamily)
MAVVVGVKFRSGGKIMDCDPGDLELSVRQAVVVETQNGQMLGVVASPPRQKAAARGGHFRGRVVRLATPEDIERHHRNEAREAEAMRVCADRVRKRGLPMKLICADFALDGSQVTIEFASETRVDFRELVRDVASAIRARVIFHQVGARDHARAVGTYGHCGQPLCCARFLNTLDSVSVKMAKDQSLAINPSKFSGVCGKLMCCLRFEHETYLELREELPNPGDFLETPQGPVRVVKVNPLSGTVTARTEDQELVEIRAAGGNGSREPSRPEAECGERCPCTRDEKDGPETAPEEKADS